MAPSHEQITGAIDRVTFHAEDTGFAILKVRTQNRSEPVTVLCNAPAVNPGEKIDARGAWVDVPEYGRQFKAASVEIAPPGSVEGIERFLGSGLIHGIGPTYARKLVDKFGENIFDIIDHSSKRLEEIGGIGKKRRIEIKSSWEKQKAIRGIMVFLYEHGVGTARALRIYKTYGENAVEILRSNPYQLAKDIHGIGFKTADAIARTLGIAKESPERAAAGVHHLLQTASDQGHCALPESELLAQAAELLESGEEIPRAALDSLLVSGELIRKENSSFIPHPSSFIYLPELLHAEKTVAEKIRGLADAAPSYPPIEIDKALEWSREKTGIELGESQARAVTEALRNRALIITGGPGVGKTTILNVILRILTAKKINPVLCAPTGRAAKRLSESTGRDAFTIHRLLEYQPATGFGRNEDRPLVGDLFVMDETSMVDIVLMHHFLKALPEDAHLLLVGDTDQLPSVGPGNLLRDLIASETVTTVRLTDIFRQNADSRIVQVAHEINHGHIPDLTPPPALKTENLKLETSQRDFHFIARDTPERIAETITHLVRERLPEKFGLDPLHDIQVLTPMHRNSLGTVALNQRLQAALNPENEIKFEIERFGVTFRAGDKVLQLRNNYEKDVFNGDIGVITGIDTDPVKVHVRFDGGRTAEYEPGELDELQLAYAITIHKSQGSEFPAVIVPVSTQHYIMLQRNLLYTAITRGKRLVILVGDSKALELAIRNAETTKRYSGLLSRLQP